MLRNFRLDVGERLLKLADVVDADSDQAISVAKTNATLGKVFEARVLTMSVGCVNRPLTALIVSTVKLLNKDCL